MSKQTKKKQEKTRKTKETWDWHFTQKSLGMGFDSSLAFHSTIPVGHSSNCRFQLCFFDYTRETPTNGGPLIPSLGWPFLMGAIAADWKPGGPENPTWPHLGR